MNVGDGRTKAQILTAAATEAAQVRDALTHPDVVALRVERTRSRVDRLMWSGIVLGLLFTMVNVQQFAAGHAERYSLGWWAAWLLDPTVSVVLLGVLIAEREAARWQIPMGIWSRAAKWSLLAATYVMNTWQSWAVGSPSGIVLHSVPPLAVFVAAEAVTDCQDKLIECVHRAHTWATQRAERKSAAERETAEQHKAGEQVPSVLSVTPTGPTPVPIAAPVLAPFRVVPDRTDTIPAERITERSADRCESPARPVSAVRPGSVHAGRAESAERTGPTRARTGGSRTDAQLSRAVRELAEQTGGPPSQYAIKQRLGVGSGRAARLLAELDTTPAGASESNGEATRKESAR